MDPKQSEKGNAPQEQGSKVQKSHRRSAKLHPKTISDSNIQLGFEELGKILDMLYQEIYFFEPQHFRFIYANKGAIDNLGYTLEEIVQLTVLSIKPLYNLTLFKKLISAIAQKKISNLTFETIHQRKDGSTYPVSILLQLFHQKHYAFFVACVTDISHQKNSEEQIKSLLSSEQGLNEELLSQTEELLQTVEQTIALNQKIEESQRLYQLLANNIEDMVTLHDIEGYYLYASPSFLEKTGYQANEIIGQSGYLVIHPEDVHRVFTDSHELVKLGKTNRIKWRCKHKCGYYFWVETTSNRIDSTEGEFIVCCTRDITLQHEIEEKNQQYLSTLSAILESSNNLIYTLNVKKQFIAFNSAFRQFAKDYFGTVVQLNAHCDGIFQGSGHEIATRKEWDRALSGDFFTIRRAYVAPGLPELVFDISYSPIKNTLGQIMGISVFSQNITDKVFAENEFRREAARNQEILESITDAMLVLDHNWCFTYANKKAQEILNKSFEDIQGQNIWLLYGKALENSSISKKLLQDGFVNPVQVTEYIPSVSSWFEINCYPNESGLSVYFRNVTERKNNELAIAEKETLLSSINKNIQEGIYRSIEGKGIVYANDAFAKLFGFQSPEEVTGLRTRDLIADPIRRNELVAKAIAQGRYTNEEIELVRKDGTHFWGLVSAILVQHPSGIHVFDGAVRDITQLKAHEAMLKQKNEALTDLNHALDRFVYSISHDLRAPIASALGLIEITRYENDPEKIGHYLDLQAKSLRKLDSYIGDIMDFSRNERTEVACERVHFQPLIDAIFELYSYSENLPKIKKEITVTEYAPCFSDEKRITVVLNNLISNAIRYYNPYIAVPFIKVTAIVQPETIEITVADNGLGIEKQHQEKVFGMFYRATDRVNGSGLGLYIVKETLDKMQGHICMESVPGKGTSFTVSLPNRQQPGH